MRVIFALVAVALGLLGCGDEPPPYTPAHYAGQYGPQAIAYRFPVRGAWVVIRTHYNAQNDQRWALDLGVRDDDGKRAEGRGRKNSDYGAYNQPVVADAPGVIAVVVDGVPENEPRTANVYDLHGNYVVIDHQNGEYSLMAHFIPHSIRVRPGQRVQAGEELGRCGNSGHSGEPHVHWQVMNHPQAHLAQAVQPRYAPYHRNGQVSTAPPDKGDIVASD
jgi:murein DD-endopeptidase MepM/ murein hydrolase activator NlpD